MFDVFTTFHLSVSNIANDGVKKSIAIHKLGCLNVYIRALQRKTNCLLKIK
jgi:hypothetical protein